MIGAVLTYLDDKEVNSDGRTLAEEGGRMSARTSEAQATDQTSDLAAKENTRHD